jgi:hypothetical protein
VRDYHKLGKCWLSKESVVRCFEVDHLELQVFSVEIFLSPNGHGKSNLTDRGRCCTRDYAMERSPTMVQCRSG